MKHNPSHLGTADLCTMFGVGVMTVYNWRKGSTRISPLPCKTKVKGEKRHKVYFLRSQVISWAKRNHITLAVDLELSAPSAKVDLAEVKVTKPGSR